METSTNSHQSIQNGLKDIIKSIDNSDELGDEQINALKNDLREIENKLRTKLKPRTITISGSVHGKLKNHCETFELKIGEYVENLILANLENAQFESVDEKEYSAKLSKKFEESRKVKNLN